MNFSYFIARRVARAGQRSFSRLIIRIAAAAVALSVAVMIATTALIAGFKKEISGKIFGFWGHIHITDADVHRNILDSTPLRVDDSFPRLDTVGRASFYQRRYFFGAPMETLTTSRGGVRHTQVFALKPGIIKAKDEIEGIILKGVGEDFDWDFMARYLVEGETLALSDTAMSSDILLSRQTADRLRVGLGDRFIVHFVEKGEQLRRRFTVKGIYKTGLEEYDRKFALVDIRQIQRLMGWSANEVSGVEVFIDDLRDLDILTEHIYYTQLPSHVYAESIREKLPEIFDWLDLQDINEIVMLSLMTIVAIINMITTLMILILERANMIGILKALGADNWSIRKIFLYHAAFIIAAGLFWGNLAGLGMCYLQARFELIRLDEANYYLSVAPIHINVFTVLALNAGTMIIALAFLIIPSYLVTSISPVRAIRFK
jgi:lipoprotein-releasing system permease protein